MPAPSVTAPITLTKITPTSGFETTLEDAVNTLKNPPRVSVYHSTTNSIGTTPAAMAWDSELYDTAGMHSTSVNNSRLTATETGLYFVNLAVQVVEGAGTTSIGIFLSKNSGGTPGAGLLIDREYLTSAGYTNHSLQITTTIDLAAGDYVDSWVFRTGGTTGNTVASNLLSYFEAHMISYG